VSGQSPAVFRRRDEVEGDNFAAEPLGLLGRDPEGVYRPIDLEAGIADGFPGLKSDGPGEILAAPSDLLGDDLQGAAPLKAGHPPGRAKCAVRRGNGLLDLAFLGEIDLADDTSVKGRAYLPRILRILPTTVNEKLIGIHRFPLSYHI